MDEEFYIAESLKADKEGILFLADLWEKIESFCKHPTPILAV